MLSNDYCSVDLHTNTECNNIQIPQRAIDNTRHTQPARKSEYIYFLSVDFKIHFLAQSMIYDLLAHLFVCWIQLDLCKIFPCIPSVKCTCMDISMQGLLPNLLYFLAGHRPDFPFQLNVSILSVQERSLSQLAIGNKKVCDLFI